MAIRLPEARNRIAFFDVRQPSFDAVGDYVVVWYCITRAVVSTEIAAYAIVLDSEFSGFVERDGQVSGDKTWPEV